MFWFSAEKDAQLPGLFWDNSPFNGVNACLGVDFFSRSHVIKELVASQMIVGYSQLRKAQLWLGAD